MNLMRRLLCEHKDEIKETFVTPSPWEQRHPPTAIEIKEGQMDLLPWFFSRPVTTVVQCKRCGRVEHITSIQRP